MMGVGHFEFSWLWTSLLISGVLAGDWVVHVPVNPIRAPQGSSVMLPCTYDFPEGSGPYRVLSEMWCLNQRLCITPNYVYHSAGIFPEPAYRARVQYLGTLGSKNCSIRIDNLRMTDSGVYVFRFITTHPDSKLPIQRGVTLQVTDVPVNTSVTIANTGNIVEGTSLTLSCTSDTSSPTNFTWFQNNGTVTSFRGTGQRFSITNVTGEDGGLYTCMAQNAWGSQNATFPISIHKAAGGSSLTVVGILVGIILAILAIAVITVCVKRRLASKSHQRVLTDDINL